MEKGKTIILKNKEEADRLLRDYCKVFDCVRLIDGAYASGDEKIYAVYSSIGQAECEHVVGKIESCKNCVVKRAFESKSSATKLELYGDKIFQSTAVYAEIDGKPYVIELIKKFTDDLTSEDVPEHESMLGHIESYYEKIYTDVLTGCYNRRYFEEKLRDVPMKAGVALLDIDDFKLYNDVYGHDVGDEVLKIIAGEIKDSIRSTDKLIRYGGDEFLLIMPDIKQRVFFDELYRVKARVGGIEFANYSGIKLSVSVGGVMSEGRTMSEAVSMADIFMYKAKKEKNVVVTDFDEKTLLKRKSNVLIVDDSELNREILASILKNEFNIIEAGGGEECVAKLKKYGDDLAVVLLDVVMPGMDGFSVLDYMNLSRIIETVPVIMITGDESDETMKRAYDMGVSDFITRPFDMKVVYRRVVNTIQLYSNQRRLIDRLTRQMVEQENDSRVMTGILSHIVEFRNGESGRHVIMIRKLTELLLKTLLLKTDEYNITSQDVTHIINASALHDIGKIAIDEKIINKPGKLTKEEFEIMKAHTVIGSDIIRSLKAYSGEPLLKFADEICRYHHERWDGKGYPEGLKGNEIPISAQIVSICDVYDALVEKRVYKEAYPQEKAINMILSGECGIFNPLIVECFTEVADDIREIEGNKEIR